MEYQWELVSHPGHDTTVVTAVLNIPSLVVTQPECLPNINSLTQFVLHSVDQCIAISAYELLHAARFPDSTRSLADELKFRSDN